MEEWKSVGSYNDLIKKNIDFIEGRLQLAPYHQAPINDTGPLRDDLVEINKLGFITLGGQCALDTPEHEKKLYLNGYLSPSKVRNFIKYLKDFKKIEYFIEFPNKEIKTNIRNWHINYNIKENQSVYFSSLGRVKKDNTWVDTDILPFRDINYITLTFWKDTPKILDVLKEYCFIHIQHRSFHNTTNDLYTIVKGFFAKKDFKPKKDKSEKHEKSEFGKRKGILLRLKRDLKKVESNSLFGVKKGKVTKESKVTKELKVTKEPFYKRAKAHFWRHKGTYVDWGIKLALAAAIKKAWNKSSVSQHNKEKKKLKQEQRLRTILREEIHKKK